MWARRWDSASSAERGMQNHRAVLPKGGASGTSGSVTNSPKTWRLQTAFIISQCLWVRNLGAAQLHLLLQGPSQAVIQVSAGAAVSSEGSQGKDPLPSSLTIMGRILFLEGCWMEGLSPLLEVGWTPPSVPHHMAVSHVAAHNTFCQSERAKKARVCAGERGHHRLLNESHK